MAEVQTQVINWLEISQKAEGKSWTEPTVAYEFTGRTFYDPGQAFTFTESTTPLPGETSLYADNYADNYA